MSSSEQQQQYRPMVAPERKSSLKLKKGRVLQSVFRQIYEDTEKWWHTRFDCRSSSQQEQPEEDNTPQPQTSPLDVGSQDRKHVEGQQES
jgi:hypothetical protein